MKLIAADHSGNICILNAVADKGEMRSFINDIRSEFEFTEKVGHEISCWGFDEWEPSTTEDWKGHFNGLLNGHRNEMRCDFKGDWMWNRLHVKSLPNDKYHIGIKFDEGDLYGVDQEFASNFLVRTCEPDAEEPSTVVIDGDKTVSRY